MVARKPIIPKEMPGYLEKRERGYSFYLKPWPNYLNWTLVFPDESVPGNETALNEARKMLEK
jgi:hypothetical protein